MNQFTTEIIDALVKKQDITEVFRSHLEMAINSLLATELTEFLNYEKYDRMALTPAIHAMGLFTHTSYRVW